MIVLKKGLKFSVDIPQGGKAVDFEVVRENGNGSYNLAYRYQKTKGGRGGVVEYNVKQIHKYLKEKNWIIISIDDQNNLPEELFKI